MKIKVLEQNLDYDGTQLRSLFGYLDHKVLGDSLVVFRGACNVDFSHMVDGEDLLALSEIKGSDMVHFIFEHFQMTLPEAVARQRLFTAIVQQQLFEKTAKHFTRDGDDLFLDGRKFSISIATQTPVSSMIHFAFNISNEGTPVKTCALEDLGLVSDWRNFSMAVAETYAREDQTIREASCKVRWVR